MQAVGLVLRQDVWVFPKDGRGGAETASLGFGDVSKHSQEAKLKEFPLVKSYCNRRHLLLDYDYGRKK